MCSSDLTWIEDESNRDTYYLRNFLRAEVLPLIEARVPDYRNALSRAGAHMADASQLLDDLARMDGAGAFMGESLSVAALQPLPAARARNLLRYFLASRGVAMPDARRLGEALRQIITARNDARVCVDIGSHVLRRFAGAIYVTPRQASGVGDLAFRWRGERRLEIPALQAALEMRRARGRGIDLARLLAKPVTLRMRRGGEKLQPDAARPRRAVKDLLRERLVPPWQRERLPYLWAGGRLVWVAGLGIDCAFQAAKGKPGVVPRWVACA